jgi:hypothetical protein
MLTRTLLSAAALSIAMLASGAMAQTKINGIDVSADDLPKVQAQCDALAIKDTAASTASNTTEQGSDTNNSDAPQTADPAATNADGASGMDQATTAFDLSTLTLDQCKEAGLIK